MKGVAELEEDFTFPPWFPPPPPAPSSSRLLLVFTIRECGWGSSFLFGAPVTYKLNTPQSDWPKERSVSLPPLTLRICSSMPLRRTFRRTGPATAQA